MQRQMLFGLAALAIAGLAGGCAKEYTPTQEITTVREATEEEKSAREASTAERMRVADMPAVSSSGVPGAAPASDAAPAPALSWVVPEGWEELPSTPMRTPNLRLKSNPEVEMYLTVLPGEGGGLVENINRWYGQMGQEPLTPEQVDALPGKPFLFKVGKFVNLRGTFTGMGGAAMDNYQLYGLALISEGQAYFIKLTGPADVAEPQLNAFTLFYQSIFPKDLDTSTAELVAVPGDDAVAQEAALVEEAPAEAAVAAEAAAPAEAAAAMPAPAAAPSAASSELPMAGDLKWDVPAGWEKSGDRPMRAVTFTVNGAECYISVLGGAAGGLTANIGRWYGQMGLEAPDEAAIAALEQVTVLGAPCALVNIEGNYQGMGGPSYPDYKMLGVAREGSGQSVFVKMVGPKDVVAAETDNFRAFVQSLR